MSVHSPVSVRQELGVAWTSVDSVPLLSQRLRGICHYVSNLVWLPGLSATLQTGAV